jgi:hypothetical protein
MATEKVHVKIGISGTYWDKHPKYRILFNNAVITDAEITADSDTVEYFEFDAEYSTEKAVLQIELLNKEDSDTVQSDDKTAILKDMLLNIVSIEVDEIDLGFILVADSEYHVNKPVHYNGEITKVVKNCVNLGWNGTWNLTWNNPFYLWLLEKL